MYTQEDIRRLEQDVQGLEYKNRKLRDILAQIGIKTGTIQTGHVRTQELRDVEHFGHTERVPLEHQTKEQIKQGRSIIKQEYSRTQAPTDPHGARHVSTVKNTSYFREEDEQRAFGQKVIDESRVVEKTFTYNRSELNKEERSFGGVNKDRAEMEYRSQRVEAPIDQRSSHMTGNQIPEANLTTNYNTVSSQNQLVGQTIQTRTTTSQSKGWTSGNQG